MLRRDVVAAVEAGRFHVYALRTVDDGLELLTGLAAGARDESGEFPPGTFNQLVELRLQEFAEFRREFDAPLPLQAASSDALSNVVSH